MRSLFWKIFLVFWVSNLVVLALTFSLRWNQVTDFQKQHVAQLYEYAEQAAQSLEREGPPGLHRSLRKLAAQHQIQAFLMDSTGLAYGRPPPPHITDQIVRIPQTITPLQNKAGPFFIHAIEVQLESSQRYRFVSIYHPIDGRHGPRRPLIGLLLFLFPTITLASALIARFITRPLRTMQSTTAQFASGDRSARIPAKITRRKDAIGDLGREFDALAEQVDGLLTTQQQLLRDVSHELRSPLARIQVALVLLEKRITDGDGGELERIHIELERLDQLIGQVLTLSRLESGAENMALDIVPLRPLIETVIDDCEFEFAESTKQVQLTCNESLTLPCDPDKFRSALENVLRNALRYTPDDSTVEVTATTADTDSSELVIRIADRGPGVPERDLPHLFDPFYRVSEARDEHSGGHGVGLAITRRVIELHHGTVRAENNPDGGLVIVFTLPLRSLHTL